MVSKGKGKGRGVVANTEAFIKEELRDLPIGICYVNEKWLISGSASVIITRQHSDGHVSCGIYLVDLLCLGVKDTFYLYHINQKEFEEVLDAMEENEPLLEVEYILMHSLINGAVEYGKSLGFEPHESYELTGFFLDHTDKTDQLIEIPFGMNGKPAVIISEEDKQEELCHLLTERLGQDGFLIMNRPECEELRQNMEFGSEDFSYNDLLLGKEAEEDDLLSSGEDSLLGDYVDYTEEQLLEEISLLGKEDISNALGAVHELYCRLQAPDEPAQDYEEKLKIYDELTVVNDFDFPGLDFLPEDQADIFYELSEMTEEEPESAIPEIKKAIRNFPHPVFEHLLVSAYSYLNQEDKSKEVLSKALEKYSNDFMLRIGYGFNLLMEEKYQVLKMYMSNFDIQKVVPERKIFHITEIGRFLSLACSYYAVTGQLWLATCFQNELDSYTGIPEVTYYQKLATFNILCPMQWEVIRQHYGI